MENNAVTYSNKVIQIIMELFQELDLLKLKPRKVVDVLF